MSVSFGQDSAWMKFSDGSKAVDMAKVLYVEYTEAHATSAVSQASAAATLHLPDSATVRLIGNDIERARAWIDARVADKG